MNTSNKVRICLLTALTLGVTGCDNVERGRDFVKAKFPGHQVKGKLAADGKHYCGTLTDQGGRQQKFFLKVGSESLAAQESHDFIVEEYLTGCGITLNPQETAVFVAESRAVRDRFVRAREFEDNRRADAAVASKEKSTTASERWLEDNRAAINGLHEASQQKP